MELFGLLFPLVLVYWKYLADDFFLFAEGKSDNKERVTLVPIVLTDTRAFLFQLSHRYEPGT